MRAILTYHSIDDSGSAISLPAAAFERHVRFLASGAVRVVPLEDLAAAPDGEPAVALTFDDGFENFASVAWPRMRDAGLPATVFLVSDHVGRDNRWGGVSERGIPQLRLMDWATAARLARDGAALGSHTRTHASLPALDDAALAEELDASRAHIAAETGVTPRTFAYPYGDHDERCAAAVAGRYAIAVTTELAPLAGGDDLRLLPRLDAYYLQAPGRIESFGSPAFRRWFARRALLRRIRSGVLGARRPAPAASSRKRRAGKASTL